MNALPISPEKGLLPQLFHIRDPVRQPGSFMSSQFSEAATPRHRVGLSE